jgi:hypothetical protein
LPEWDSGLVVICTDCIDSYKSNYYAITTMTASLENEGQLIILLCLKCFSRKMIGQKKISPDLVV